VLKSDCLIGAQVKLQKRLRVLCMQPICKCGSEISLFRVSISRSFWNHLGEKKTHCSCNTLIELTIHFDCRKNTNTKVQQWGWSQRSSSSLVYCQVRNQVNA
jgi:hypothetical protein